MNYLSFNLLIYIDILVIGGHDNFLYRFYINRRRRPEQLPFALYGNGIKTI
jgi:hypothetical protein